MERPRRGAKLFTKELTATDIGYRLHWPSEHLPLLPDFNGKHQVDFTVKDITGQSWAMKCSKRIRGQYDKPVISSGWLPFLHGRPHKLKENDEVTFYGSLDADAHFVVGVKRKVVVFKINLNDVEE